MTNISHVQASRLATWIVTGVYVASALFFTWLSAHRGGAIGPALIAIGLAILAIFYFVKNGIVKERRAINDPAKLPTKILLWMLWIIGAIFLVAGSIVVWL